MSYFLSLTGSKNRLTVAEFREDDAIACLTYHNIKIRAAGKRRLGVMIYFRGFMDVRWEM